EEDAERLFWRYMRYLRPYEGSFLSPEEVSNRKQMISEALAVATEYPYGYAKNKLLVERYAFEQVAFAFEMAAFDYAFRGFPSRQDARKLAIAGEMAFEKLASNYPLYENEQKGIYGLFLMHLMQLTTAVLVYNWEEEGYTCNDELVSTFAQLRSNFPERIRKT